MKIKEYLKTAGKYLLRAIPVVGEICVYRDIKKVDEGYASLAWPLAGSALIRIQPIIKILEGDMAEMIKSPNYVFYIFTPLAVTGYLETTGIDADKKKYSSVSTY